MSSQTPRPTNLAKDGDDKLIISWSDGLRTTHTWQNLRNNCPCASCREERLKPPDPFRILKPSELVPLNPVQIEPVGYYAYKITWSDGHDTGIFTLELLRELAEK
ncbi:MAG: DUF971 domain-containing protein [Planctomycetes bacterium]|nr:DUF971 domain-containing protein [Planctomycetota bacterium]